MYVCVLHVKLSYFSDVYTVYCIYFDVLQHCLLPGLQEKK